MLVVLSDEPQKSKKVWPRTAETTSQGWCRSEGGPRKRRRPRKACLPCALPLGPPADAKKLQGHARLASGGDLQTTWLRHQHDDDNNCISFISTTSGADNDENNKQMLVLEGNRRRHQLISATSSADNDKDPGRRRRDDDKDLSRRQIRINRTTPTKRKLGITSKGKE